MAGEQDHHKDRVGIESVYNLPMSSIQHPTVCNPELDRPKSPTLVYTMYLTVHVPVECPSLASTCVVHSVHSTSHPVLYVHTWVAGTGRVVGRRLEHSVVVVNFLVGNDTSMGREVMFEFQVQCSGPADGWTGRLPPCHLLPGSLPPPALNFDVRRGGPRGLH